MTNETPQKVASFILQNNITYPVALSKKTQAYGTGGIPHAYLVAPDGKVVWDGHPARLSGGQIEKLLRKTRDFYVRKVVPQLKPAATAFTKGKLAEAEKLADRVRESASDNAVIDDAKYVIERVATVRNAWNARIESGTKAGIYADVIAALRQNQKHIAGTRAAEAATANNAALQADPAVKAELKASKALEKLYKENEKASSRKKKQALAKRVRKFQKKYAGTKAAERAERFLRALRSAK